MADNINYGPSAAQLATASAGAYEQGSAATLADINRQIADESARMEAAIVAGMSPQETEAMNARVNALKQRAANVIASSEGAYQFAQEQATAAADLYAKQTQDVQAAQRALAAQALGQAQTGAMPGGGYSRFTAEGARSLRENAAAAMAAVGGEGGVPASALVPTAGLVPTSGTGLTGAQQQQALLFGRALTAGQARALSEIQAQQMALATDIELKAQEAAREREAKERARVTDFRTSMFQYATQLAAQIGTNLAELKAKAAGADTRTGKQIADAELKLYERKAAIDWKNTMKEIAARAKASGASAADVAAAQAQANYALGGSTDFGKFITNKVNQLAYIPTDRAAGGVVLSTERDKDGKFKPLTFTGKDRFYVNQGVLIYNENPAGKNSKDSIVDITKMNEVLAVIGDIQTRKPAEQAKLWNQYWNSQAGLGDLVTRRAVAAIIGSKEAVNSQWWLNSIQGKTAGSFTPELSRQTAQRQQQAALPKVTTQVGAPAQGPFNPRGTLARFTEEEKKRQAALLRPGISISARK